MDSELENKAQDLSTEQNESTREGYSRPTGGYTNNYQGSGRPQRPRIHNQRAYTTDHNDSENEGGFRPEGFGSALQNGDRPQRPYQPRQGGYGRPQPGGYNNNRGGGF